MTEISKVLATPSAADQLADKFVAIMKKHFPKSFHEAYFSTNLSPSITMRFGLVADKGKLWNGIRENDPASMGWLVYGFDRDGNITGPLSLDSGIKGCRLDINPEPGQNLVFQGLKLGWRKKQGDEAAVLKHFDQFMAKAKKLMKDNQDNIYAHNDPKQLKVYQDALV